MTLYLLYFFNSSFHLYSRKALLRNPKNSILDQANRSWRMHLIPWPGPQVIPLMRTLERPCPREMQSSPVAIFVFSMVTSEQRSTCIPSVFGLSPGAMILRLVALKLLHPTTPKWKFLLFRDVMPLMAVLFIELNLTFCKNIKIFKFTVIHISRTQMS